MLTKKRHLLKSRENNIIFRSEGDYIDFRPHSHITRCPKASAQLPLALDAIRVFSDYILSGSFGQFISAHLDFFTCQSRVAGQVCFALADCGIWVSCVNAG